MILPYHDIATAAALSQAGVCSARPATKIPGQDSPLFLTACGSASTVYTPPRWLRVLGAVLSPISGPTISPPRSGASNI
jgi:hypothetical protein